MTRLLNKQLHEQALGGSRRPNKAAGTDPNPTETAGKGPTLRLRRNDREEAAPCPNASGDPAKSGAPPEPRKAYPAGRRLTPQEVTRSVTHAPIDPKSKKPIYAGTRRVISDALALAALMRMSPFQL